MAPSDWPRPQNDTGVGAHDDPDCYAKPANVVEFADWIYGYGVRWYLMWIWDENKSDFCRALRNRGIEVIVRPGPAHMPRPNIDVVSQIEAYIDAGARWFVLGNEYNLHEEWSTENAWKHLDKPLRHVAEWYVRMAGVVRERGGWPLTPPPSLGGHMLHREWFTRFMYALQNIAAEQGVSMKSLLYPGGIGIHCRSVGNPLTAGPADYDCSAREWEWFDATVRSFIGESLPMVNCEAFDEPNWLPKVGSHYDWNLWKARNIEQFKWFDPKNEGYRYPPEVLANCFWVIQAHRHSPWPQCGLIGNYPHYVQRGDYVTELWKDMSHVVTWTRGDSVEPPPPPPPPPPTKLRVYDAEGTKKDLAWAEAKYGVKLEPYQGKGWHVTIMHEKVNCAAGLDMWFYDEHGAPARNVPVHFCWPGNCDTTKKTEVDGKIGWGYGPDSWVWDPEVGGPHWVTIASDEHQDKLSRLGMKAMTNHDHLDFTWRYGDSEDGLPTDPLKVIMPLAEMKLGAIPVPADWAYPKVASEHGFEYQVGGYGQVEILGKMWGFQTFTNDDQSEYGVAYSPEGEYDKTEWAIIPRD